MFLDFSKNVIKAKSVPRSRIRSPFRLQNQRSIKWNQRQLQSTMEIFGKRKLQRRLTLQIGPSSGEASATSSATAAGCRRSASSPGFRICFPRATSSWIFPRYAGPPRPPPRRTSCRTRQPDLPPPPHPPRSPPPASRIRPPAGQPNGRRPRLPRRRRARPWAHSLRARDGGCNGSRVQGRRPPSTFAEAKPLTGRGGRCGVSRWSVSGRTVHRMWGGGGSLP